MKPPSARPWFRLTPKKLDFIGLFSLVLTVFWMLSVTALNGQHVLPSWANGGDRMVVFTARWCASCVTLVPSIQSVSNRLHIPVTLIDVDSTSAPGQASQFGLQVTRSSLPQAYLVQGGKHVLVLNGAQYNAGDSGKASQDVESKVNANR
jgi:thiol-disulfide isomerase/thioredoxin